MRFTLGHGLLGAFMLAGCFSDGGGEGCTSSGNGILGGDFRYDCTSNADIHCDPSEGVPANVLPAAVALGSTFNLEYGSDRVVPIAPEAVATTTNGFRALREGHVGFTAMRTGSGELVDAVRLPVVAPQRIVVEPLAATRGTPAPREVVVRVGADTSLRAVPRGMVSAFEQRLAGSLDVMWSIEGDPDGLVLDVSSAPLARLRAERAGKWVVRAQADAGEATIEVRTEDGPPPLPDGGIDDAGADAESLVEAGVQ